jgi:predicted HTH transcriptional regulator
MDLDSLLRQREAEWLDFKKEYHDNNASLLHDILCLANSYSNSDRYLVFGVADDHSVTGVAADINRKTNANLQDFLRQANLNRIPTCVIEQHDVGADPTGVHDVKT